MPTEQSDQTPETDDLFTGRIPILQALEKLRIRLLDLTLRNRLLNFKHSPGRCLQFVEAQPDTVFHRLMEGSDKKIVILSIPEPPRSAWETIGGRLTKPDAKDYAKSLGIDTSFELPIRTTGNNSTNIRTLHYPKDQEPHCRKLSREMKSALEETGAHMLFLVFGFLEFPEAGPANRTMTAPLISVPVTIEKGELDRETRHYRYQLSYTGEELEENLSLREKLRRDHGFELPAFDESQNTPDQYCKEIQHAIKDKHGWKIKRQMTLTLLSFTKMLLVRDIDPSKWPPLSNGVSGLVDHPIVRMVFEGTHESDSGGSRSTLSGDYDVDQHALKDLPLIYDADSSQHCALIDAMSGRMVIEGPPGTGKSQTITNLIAAAITEGKKVLFVSEKRAALEVVEKRLGLAGLGDFCLELHSNKTQKKRVLEAIETRKNKRFPLPYGLSAQLSALQEKRRALKAYVDLLNSVVGNVQGITIHSILWKAERYRQGSGKGWRAAQELIVPKAHELTDAEFQSLRDTLIYVSRQYQQIENFDASHPFWGFFPTELMPGSELKLEYLLRNLLPKLETFQKTIEDATAFLGEQIELSPEMVKMLIPALISVSPAQFRPKMAHKILPTLFCLADPEAKVAETAINQFDHKLKTVHKLRADVAEKLKCPDNLTKSDGDTAEILRRNLSSLKLTDWPCLAIEALSEEALGTSSDIRYAISKLEECGKIVGLPFDGSEGAAEKISLIVDIARDAPLELLHYRHQGLKRHDAVSVVEKARDGAHRIMHERISLSEIFYLDAIPAANELKQAILVLREGGTWYRIFQSRWRKACHTHSSLDKTKTKKSSSQRLHELEKLLTLQKESADWNANQHYKDVLGPFYQGEETAFDEATALISWYAGAERALIEAGLSENAINLLEVPKARLVEMAAYHSQLEQVLATIAKGKNILEKQFPESQAIKDHIREATNLLLFADLLEKLGSITKAAANKLLTWSPGRVSATESLQAVTAHLALPNAIKEVENDTLVRALLGQEFKNTETDLQPTLDALEYGRNVLALNLPPPITRLLLSDNARTNFEEFKTYLTALQEGWVTIDDFSRNMSEHGKFDLSCWAGKDLSSPEFLTGLMIHTEQAVGSMNKLLPWVQYLQATERARERGLSEFISLLECGKIDSGYLADAFGYRFYGSILLRLFKAYPQLEQFSGATHETIREEFANLDRKIIKLRGQECAHKTDAAATPPSGTSGAKIDDKTELSLLNYLLSQTRPRMPIRKMMRQAGRAIQAYKPCFMMGPQAAAQFLEPGTVKFDIVVMDEASQLKPEEAIGAIARGNQLIVVGDPKQLPPTAFFDRLSTTEEEDEGQQAAALISQSILDVCMGHFHPVRTLRWHYRSKHESLIAFSNHNFYKNLIIFPSPYPKGKSLGVQYKYIADGVYGDQVNHIEAKHVTDAIIDHMLNYPEDSLGVVTLNLKQRDLIEDLLEQRCRNIQKTEDYRNKWEREGMGFFVKNLENVQGDERDIIFISATFGKAYNTNVVRQNFGPISRGDGWRRLNVLFTRARKAVQVFTSMQPEDIIVDVHTPMGTKILHDYLEYARSGILMDITPTGGEAESDFEAAVANVLRTHGFEVEPQLGVAGFRIDLAVKHPNYLSAYLAAIECDGATYHSGVSVRDRDRIRQEILENLGWKNKIWRIWSTDWFRNSDRETARLITFLNELKNKPVDGAYFHETGRN